MNKKLLVALSAAMVLGMAACGGASHPSEGYSVFGNFMIGEIENGWDSKTTEVYDSTLMTKLDVENLEGDAKTLLDGKTAVSEAYIIDNVLLGTIDAGWNANAMLDGVKVSCNGSFAIKAGAASYDAGDKIWSMSQWIPDAGNTHVENLSEDVLFLPAYQEEKDANGFGWNDNPVCIGGAGQYSVVVAKYSTSAGEDSFNYGLGLVKKAAKESSYDGYTENGSIKVALDSAAGDVVSFLGIYSGIVGSDHYVASGDYAIDVYKFELDVSAVAIGDPVLVEGTISIYKGLIEVTPTSFVKYTGKISVPAASAAVAIDGSWGNKYLVSRECTVAGTVVLGKAIDGTANVTVAITVGTGEAAKSVNIYVKKGLSTVLNYTDLNAALSVTGATVSLKGWVGIYDGAATVDYAASTGYQVIYPSVVTAA